MISIREKTIKTSGVFEEVVKREREGREKKD